MTQLRLRLFKRTSSVKNHYHLMHLWWCDKVPLARISLSSNFHKIRLLETRAKQFKLCFATRERTKKLLRAWKLHFRKLSYPKKLFLIKKNRFGCQNRDIWGWKAVKLRVCRPTETAAHELVCLKMQSRQRRYLSIWTAYINRLKRDETLHEFAVAI